MMREQGCKGRCDVSSLLFTVGQGETVLPWITQQGRKHSAKRETLRKLELLWRSKGFGFSFLLEGENIPNGCYFSPPQILKRCSGWNAVVLPLSLSSLFKKVCVCFFNCQWGRKDEFILFSAGQTDGTAPAGGPNQ